MRIGNLNFFLNFVKVGFVVLVWKMNVARTCVMYF